MLALELGGRRYPVAAGEMIVGSDDEALLPLAGAGVAPRHAVVQGWPDGSAAVRAISGAEVLVNGVRLGPEPTPILHGDKLFIAGQEILVVDQARAGRTEVMRAIDLPADLPDSAGAPAGMMTGGRLVSQVDGREYRVGIRPLLFGRDAGADVVIGAGDVSRRHAEVQLRVDGYYVADMSVNGTYVNGVRVTGERRLARGDVLRMGDEEFRFHADAAAAAPPGAEQRLNDTMFGVPALRADDAVAPSPVRSSGPLASLLIRTGSLKGERLHIRVPVANVGRADYNDLVITDPSVSTMHAMLQSRGGVWVLSDLGSTNGTFVDDELVRGEVPLSPGATIRFGEVAALFEPVDDVAGPRSARVRARGGRRRAGEDRHRAEHEETPGGTRRGHVAAALAGSPARPRAPRQRAGGDEDDHR